MAREAGLRFTPLGYESCELLIRKELAADDGVASLVRAARSPEFRAFLRSVERDCTDTDPADGTPRDALPA